MQIRLNTILIILVFTVLTFFIFANKSGTYLNGSEAQVYLLIIVTLASLFINSRFNNEFLEVLSVVFVVFYICRIPFIFIDEMTSDVLLRNVDVGNIPWYLFVLAVQYFFLVLCILVINPRIPRRNITGFISERIFKRILLFAGIVIAANLVRTFFFFSIHGGTLSHIPAILKTIFTENNILMLLFLSSLMVEIKVLKKYKFIIGGIIFAALFPSLHEGIKSGLLQAILLAYFAMLAMRGPLIFRVRGLAVTATLGVVSFFLFFVAKVIRAYHISNIEFDANWFVFMLNRVIGETNNISVLISSISYRIGFLDFYIQKVSNPVYEPYVNFIYYAKALIDKMTPGFDVFGVPFASRAIYSAYNGPSVILNSEVITVFGEAHLLFGFFSFVLYMAILLLIKKAFQYFKASSEAAYGLFYIYVIFSFYWWLTGSGLDMTIALIIYQGIFVFFTIGLIWLWNRKEKFKAWVNFYSH